jgi:2'-5' RNA ligase
VNRPEVGRAFVAVRPPEEVLDAVAARLGEPLARRRSQWHFTLVFLGAVARLAPVQDAVAEVAAAQAPFPLRVGGAGAFPNERRARVVWLGLEEGRAGLEALNAALGAALEPLGYAREGRQYHPHLTIDRLRVPGPVGHVLEAVGSGPVGPEWTVGEVVLYQSRTSPAGATYTALGRFPLGTGTLSP